MDSWWSVRKPAAELRWSANHADVAHVFRQLCSIWVNRFIFVQINDGMAIKQYVLLVFSTPTSSGDLSPFYENIQNFVTLRNEGLVLGINPRKDVYRFWTQLLRKYSRIFYDNASWITNIDYNLHAFKWYNSAMWNEADSEARSRLCNVSVRVDIMPNLKNRELNFWIQ